MQCMAEKRFIQKSLNAKKKDEVSVELQANGIVNSSSIFQKMEEALEV